MENNDEIVIDLREVFAILKKKILTVLGITAVFLAVAGAYVIFWPKTYESVALVNTNMANQAIFQSRSVINQLINKYGEKDDKGNLPKYGDFLKKIKLTQPRNSNYLTVAVLAKEPKLAQNICKDLIAETIKVYVRANEKSLMNEINVNKEIVTKIDDKVSGEVYAKIVNLSSRLKNLHNDILLVDEASFEDEPVAPRKVRTLAIALVLGLIFGGMYAVIKEKM